MPLGDGGFASEGVHDPEAAARPDLAPMQWYSADSDSAPMIPQEKVHPLTQRGRVLRDQMCMFFPSSGLRVLCSLCSLLCAR
jgi:hypothetical protein